MQSLSPDLLRQFSSIGLLPSPSVEDLAQRSIPAIMGEFIPCWHTLLHEIDAANRALGQDPGDLEQVRAIRALASAGRALKATQKARLDIYRVLHPTERFKNAEIRANNHFYGQLILALRQTREHRKAGRAREKEQTAARKQSGRGVPPLTEKTAPRPHGIPALLAVLGVPEVLPSPPNRNPRPQTPKPQSSHARNRQARRDRAEISQLQRLLREEMDARGRKMPHDQPPREDDTPFTGDHHIAKPDLPTIIPPIEHDIQAEMERLKAQKAAVTGDQLPGGIPIRGNTPDCTPDRYSATALKFPLPHIATDPDFISPLVRRLCTPKPPRPKPAELGTPSEKILGTLSRAERRELMRFLADAGPSP